MNNGKLVGKVAVVTGASKGIGAGIAKELAAEGAAVVVNYASSKSDADKVVDEIAKGDGKAIAVQGSVAKKADVEKLFSAAEKAFGKIDILINNAGVYEFAPLEGVTEQQFHRMFDTNVLGILLVTQEALKHFNPNGGSIVNISSLASSLTPPTAVVYNATKGAVDAITRTLAKELGPRKIRVNSQTVGSSKRAGSRLPSSQTPRILSLLKRQSVSLVCSYIILHWFLSQSQPAGSRNPVNAKTPSRRSSE